MNGNGNSVLTIGGDKLTERPFGILASIRQSLPEKASAITTMPKKKKVMKTEKIESEPEPDFSALTVKVKPSADFNAEAVKAEAKKRSEAVWGSAADYYHIKRRIAELQVVDGIELTAQFRELRDLLDEQARLDAVLARQPKSVLDQFTVNFFLCELDNLQPRIENEVIAMMNRAISLGRARKGDWKEVEVGQQQAGKEWPGHVHFRTSSGEHINLFHIFSKMPGREGTISGADKRIFKSLRSLVHRFLTFQREQAEAVSAEEATRMAEIPRYELSLRLVSEWKEGFYTLYIPNDPYRPNSWGEGAGVVQVLDLNRDKKGAQPFFAIRAEDGVGCMKSWRGENKGRWVALHIYKRYLNKTLVPASIPEVAREFSLDLCKKLLVATAYAIAQEKKVADEVGIAEALVVEE